MADAPQTVPYPQCSIPFGEQKSDLRGALGRSVGAALDRSHGSWRFCSRADRPIQLYIHDAFITPDECAGLAELIDGGRFPSPLYDKESNASFRTSESCNLDMHDSLVQRVDTRICDLLGMDPTWGEPLQGQRYSAGQEFRDHSDFFYIDQPYWEQYGAQGGQRTWTAMAYLIPPERGGATGFRLLDLEIEAQLGRLLVWNNMALDGSPNPWTLHSGMPVEAGVKYIVTKWFRERRFG